MKKILNVVLCLVIVLFLIVTTTDLNIKANSGFINDENEAKQYIGYGYNITKGKAICDPDALNLNSPILDISNQDLQNAVKVFNSSKTTYVSNTSSSVSEIAEEYGQVMSGNLSLNIGAGGDSGGLIGKIGSVNCNIDASFNTNKNSSWTATHSEEYSYYSIIATNKPVILQMDNSDLKSYLSEQFKKDLANVHNEASAKLLYEKYGTHLLTGYTLGGIFEMTNYYATDSSSYVRQSEMSFSAQVNAGISYMQSVNADVNAGFSFTENYGLMDNNSHAVNNYKCTTYGGYVFPGLTIDQAFSYYETLTEAGYMYKIWTDSINNGKNLVIVDIPQSSKMVPLWDLVPYSNEYDSNLRTYLIDSYIKICADSYDAYGEKYRDVHALDMPDEDFNIDYAFTEYGYQYYTPLKDFEGSGNYVSSYMSASDQNNSVANIAPGSIISLDYDEGEFVGAQTYWSFGNLDKYIEWLDRSSCVFKVKETYNDKAMPNINNLTLTATVNGNQEVFKKTFNIKNNSFSGGDGSETNPYLITSVDEFKKLQQENYYYGNYHFKLLCDLDLKGVDMSVIGTDNKPFNGVFDGNYHTIYNYQLTGKDVLTAEDKSQYLGIFGYNEGVIKNLYLDEKEGVFNINNVNSENETLVNFAGGIVAVNKSKGVVENCTINGLEMRIRMDNDTDSKESLIVGGIVGLNEGTVLSCIVKNSCIYANSNGVKKIHETVTGGIVGKNTASFAEVSVGNCTLMSSQIFSRCGHTGLTSFDKVSSIVGGIVGKLEKGSLNNCLVVDINSAGKEVNESTSVLRSVVYCAPSAATEKIHAYAGGITGYAGNQAIIENCIVKNVSSIRTESGNNYKSNFHRGSFVGLNDGASVKNVHIEIAKDVDNTSVDIPVHNGDASQPAGCVLHNKITWNNIPTTLNDEEWISSINVLGTAKDGNEFPMPCVDRIELEINTDNVKKLFYKGEYFKVGNIEISELHTNGDITFVKEYIINWDSFESSFSETSKNFIIHILTSNKEVSYQVVVKDPEDVLLRIEKDIQTEYYVGDNFNLSEIATYVIKANGHEESLSSSSYTIINKTTQQAGTKLVEGINNFVIIYNELQVEFNVYAEKRAVHHITVVLGSEAEKTYYVGQSNIDTKDITVEIYYDEAETIEKTIVDLSKCELIFSDFVEGKNSILVNYEDFNTTTFEVDAIYDLNNYNKIEFIELANKLDQDLTLNELYITIIRTKAALEKVGEYRDAEINQAISKLDEAIENYNEIANKVNAGFEENIEIANSFNYTILYYTTFSLLCLIIAILKNRILA